MSPDRPIFGKISSEREGETVDDEGRRPDGSRPRSGRKKGGWTRFDNTALLILDPMEKEVENTPSINWLKDSMRYQRWQNDHSPESPILVSIAASKGQITEEIFEIDKTHKRYRKTDRAPRNPKALILTIDDSILTGEAEDKVNKYITRLAPGGFVAVRIETSTAKSAKKVSDRIRALADRSPITEERITIEDGVVLVGRKWQERSGRQYDIRNTRSWRWLGPRLEKLDNTLKELGVGLTSEGRSFNTTYIPEMARRLKNGEGLLLDFPCGCRLDLTQPGQQDLVCECDGRGCSRRTVIRQVFQTRIGDCPRAYYANLAEERLINKKMVAKRGEQTVDSWERKARNPNHVFSVLDGVLSNRRIISLSELEVLGLDLEDLIPGEGVVFKRGSRQSWFGVAINFRPYNNQEYVLFSGEILGHSELRILLLAEGKSAEEFGKYF